jgi:hypothetical protein
MALLDKISWPILVVLCLTLGLAPFTPAPHIWEKLNMLAAGDLRRPVDMFDLFYHGLPWLVALAKGWRQTRQRKS